MLEDWAVRQRAVSGTEMNTMSSTQRGEPAASPSPQWIKISATPSIRDYVADIWRRRSMAVEVARNSVKSQHVDAVLGELWFLINPILLIAVYWLVFGLIFGGDRGVDNTLGFISLGVFTFDFSRTGLMRAANSMITNRGLLTTMMFPRALLPLAVMLEQVYSYLPQMAVAAGLVVLTGEPITWAWLMMPVVLAVQTVWTLGAGLVVARLSHHAHDMKEALPFVLRLALYLSGVIFNLDGLLRSERMAAVFARVGLEAQDVANAMVLNPFYDFVTLARHYMMASQPAAVPLDLLWTATITWAIVALVAGLVFFRGAEREYGRD